MQTALDGIQEMLTGQATFQDQELLNGLDECFEQFDPEIGRAIDAQWQGFLEYGLKGGSLNDSWRPCPQPHEVCNVLLKPEKLDSNRFSAHKQ